MGVKKNIREICISVFLFFLVPVFISGAAGSDRGTIRAKLTTAGFNVGKIEPVKGAYYQVKIKGIRPGHPMISSGKFSPFSLLAKFSQGKVMLKKSVLTKHGITFRANRLPGGLLVKEFSLPALRPGGTGLVSAGDPKLRRMNMALSAATRYRDLAPGKIEEIGEQVVLAKAEVDRCLEPPPPDPNRFQPADPMLPMFGSVVETLGSSYMGGSIGSCDHYPENAVTASVNASRKYSYLQKLLDEVIRIKEYVAERCRPCCMKESDRNSLKSTLDRLLSSAESRSGRFDRFVEDIERFIQQYRDCKERESENASDPIRPVGME
jgi:hypothetical protein